MEDEYNPPHPPRYARCKCAIRGDVQLNVERMMKGLWDAEVIKDSPLIDRHEESLHITADEDTFLAHLRHVGVRMPTIWTCRVITDAQLTTAWLASIALQGKDILDADAYKVSTKHLTIPDLVMPPDLVVIRMGVKVARNTAANECLAEALNLRDHEGLPTWIWDQPSHPLDSGHLFWSDVVGRILRPWDHIEDLQAPGAKKPGTKKKPGTTATPGKRRGRKSLRGGSS